jgi:hypothetical protein
LLLMNLTKIDLKTTSKYKQRKKNNAINGSKILIPKRIEYEFFTIQSMSINGILFN